MKKPEKKEHDVKKIKYSSQEYFDFIEGYNESHTDWEQYLAWVVEEMKKALEEKTFEGTSLKIHDLLEKIYDY